MPPRPDGLPQPETIADLYLAAILDELRAQRAAGSSAAQDEERVKEPEPHKKKK